MSDKTAVSRMTGIMASFISHTEKNLPDDVLAKLRDLQSKETDPLALEIYSIMFRNLDLARELGRPMCQDTGFLQFRIK